MIIKNKCIYIEKNVHIIYISIFAQTLCKKNRLRLMLISLWYESFFKKRKTISKSVFIMKRNKQNMKKKKI